VKSENDESISYPISLGMYGGDKVKILIDGIILQYHID
jgi:hypothetical protein